MATNLDQIVHHIGAFYDFAGKHVIAVGAGEGRLIEYARPARRVFAVDIDADALERLGTCVASRGLADIVQAVHADFLDVQEMADAILFEFSLHLLVQPERALAHAKGLGGDVIVLGHAPGSPWSWYAGEETMVASAWSAVGAYPVVRQQDVAAEQSFSAFDELDARLRGQPGPSRERIASLRDRAPIVIRMPYRLALL